MQLDEHDIGSMFQRTVAWNKIGRQDKHCIAQSYRNNILV